MPYLLGFPVTQLVKNLPAMQETPVQSLGWEYPQEKGMAIHSILAWRIPLTEEPSGLQSMGLQLTLSLFMLIFIRASPVFGLCPLSSAE